MPDTGNDWLTIMLFTILIFLARISDVTLGTLRIVFISRGEKYIAPTLAFFEMLIWLFAIRQIMQNINNLAYYFSYAAGFASGVFIGLVVEEKLALGLRLIRTITRKDASELVSELRKSGFGVTSVEAEGNAGNVNVIYSIIKRSDVVHYASLVKRYNPKAFYSIEDIRFVSEGIFPARKSFFRRSKLGLRMWGKTK